MSGGASVSHSEFIFFVFAALWVSLGWSIFERCTNQILDGTHEDPEVSLSILPLFLFCIFAWPLVWLLFLRVKKE